MDEWVAALHEAVKVSPVCSWEPGMTPSVQGIHSLGLCTLSYGYRFKFRFQDRADRAESEELLPLFYHGTRVGSVFEILRNNFRPRVCETGEEALKKAYGCVPPMVWFSQKYSCAANYPQHKWKGLFALGESLALDAPQPMRAIFRVRANKSEWLHKITQGKNNQFAFSPESLHSIVGLDLIATSLSAESVVNPWDTTHLGDYIDEDVLLAKLRGFFPDIAQPTHDMFTDPRHENLESKSMPFDENYKLLTDSPDEMVRLASLVKKREELLEDEMKLMLFHEKIHQLEDGQVTAESIDQLVEELPKHLRDLLQDCGDEVPEGQDSVQVALGRLSEQKNEFDSAQKKYQKSLNRLKKYKLRLRKAKGLTEICEVYEKADPHPIEAPAITPSAPRKRRRTIEKYAAREPQ